jgi:putative heme-binding domain-containing protein
MFRPLLSMLLLSIPLTAATTQEDALIVELIKRVENFDPSTASPKIKAALARYVANSRGTTGYFDSVERYKLTEEAPHLVKLMQEKPNSQEAASAAKALFSLAAAAELEKNLTTLEKKHWPSFLSDIAKSNKREAAEFLLTTALKTENSPELKTAAIKALGKSRNAEKALLKALQANQLPNDLKFQAAQVLHASGDAATREATEKLVPMPKSEGDKPLPPVATLVSRKGDPTNGKGAFTKYCFACHKVGDAGIDFGPALSEIGNKLAKEALYQSILEPSAGISFGYEGYEVKTKAGDSYLGFVAGETATELSLKVPGGVVVKVGKPDVAEKKPLGMSLMTPGLAAAMSEGELVDLVEYLTTLRKAG